MFARLLVVSFVLGLCQSAIAADVYLNLGESRYITGAQVHCGGGGPNGGGDSDDGICADSEINAAMQAVNQCIHSSSPTGPCIQSFLTNNPIVRCNAFRSQCFTACDRTNTPTQTCQTSCAGSGDTRPHGADCDSTEVSAAMGAINQCIRGSSPTAPCIQGYLTNNGISRCNSFREQCFTACDHTNVPTQTCQNVCGGN
jgi:hypothetical protein